MALAGVCPGLFYSALQQLRKNVNKAQEKVLSECPVSYRRIFERAFNGGSKSAGIRAFCLRCVGYLRNDVRDCTAYGCPLHPYRPYQVDEEDDDIPTVG
jgi:hypothetical protein